MCLLARNKERNNYYCYGTRQSRQSDELSDLEQEADENKNNTRGKVGDDMTKRNRCNRETESNALFFPQAIVNDSPDQQSCLYARIPPVDECCIDDMAFDPVNHRHLVS